ncbi:MAG: phosphoglucosamine mutase [Prevotellaceae bacterium]|jgi:phosphomannomutase|nr:phosphoglucosamine mutase [Prevotellaceae bacterium]
MALIKSISGIRGTIGGQPGEDLTPLDIVKFAGAYSAWIKERNKNCRQWKVVVGRDARPSGDMVNRLISGTLTASGIDVIDLGLATTPTVEIAVTGLRANGGIILTASHNPKQWNALKLLNEQGEFLSDADGKALLAIAEKSEFNFSEVDDLGQITYDDKTYTDEHIRAVLSLHLVDIDAIYKANFRVVVDAVNSVGGIAIPRLLASLGVNVIELNCTPNGQFPHNPEPLPEHLGEIAKAVPEKNADLGIVVDPDVDRLALVCEDGSFFGEEYTLVAVADYVLGKTAGNTVSNLSSSRALKDITEKYGGQYFSSAVGEVNVVAEMKRVNAVIGGEGNGGVIYPELHYGRDALVGVALFLSHLAQKKIKCSELRAQYPKYFVSKNKITLSPDTDIDKILRKVKDKYSSFRISDIDGIRVDFDKVKKWVHLRKSNTEPIIRIYAEAASEKEASELAKQVMELLMAEC